MRLTFSGPARRVEFQNSRDNRAHLSRSTKAQAVGVVSQDSGAHLRTTRLTLWAADFAERPCCRAVHAAAPNATHLCTDRLTFAPTGLTLGVPRRLTFRNTGAHDGPNGPHLGNNGAHQSHRKCLKARMKTGSESFAFALLEEKLASLSFNNEKQKSNTKPKKHGKVRVFVLTAHLFAASLRETSAGERV